MGLRKIIRDCFRADNISSQKNDSIASKTQTILNELFLQNRIEWLRDKTINSTDLGIALESQNKEQIIVSLTTYGDRIHNVHLAIESIMQGTLKPNKIILWLAKDEFGGKEIPLTLQSQQKRGLEIAYCHELKSYNKLIHTLKAFPDASIITIDDDVLYEYDLVERLFNHHTSHPNVICACRMHRIRTDMGNKPLPYMQWDLCISKKNPSILNFPTGVGGILYPPHCFSEEVFNDEVFMRLCPKADDIWFYAMARISNIPSSWVKTEKPEGYYMGLPITPDALSLYNTSATEAGNDKQLQKVIEYYGISLKETTT